MQLRVKKYDVRVLARTISDPQANKTIIIKTAEHCILTASN